MQIGKEYTDSNAADLFVCLAVLAAADRCEDVGRRAKATEATASTRRKSNKNRLGQRRTETEQNKKGTENRSKRFPCALWLTGHPRRYSMPYGYCTTSEVNRQIKYAALADLACVRAAVAEQLQKGLAHLLGLFTLTGGKRYRYFHFVTPMGSFWGRGFQEDRTGLNCARQSR